MLTQRVNQSKTGLSLFADIAQDIQHKGFSIRPAALPYPLALALSEHVQQMSDAKFKRAGIGREEQLNVNDFVRTDEISWINGETPAGLAWLQWSDSLKDYMNQQLYLGLFSFESHFAHYKPGDFYKTHLDAFKGQSNRVLTVVVYLNQDWHQDDGGELVIYTDGEQASQSIKVTPEFGTVVVFLSEEFPHQVLPAKRDRYSIAGWYRINNSVGNQIDPPR
ncbi:2OG-Fe(II) oxygenase [Shewanella waksmanii]|uniref:2OG-Fe(II) oxygenase n=1 Tax=Shewanella waksmanii TaxID=213783 RepID=UPI003736B822